MGKGNASGYWLVLCCGSVSGSIYCSLTLSSTEWKLEGAVVSSTGGWGVAGAYLESGNLGGVLSFLISFGDIPMRIGSLSLAACASEPNFLHIVHLSDDLKTSSTHGQQDFVQLLSCWADHHRWAAVCSFKSYFSVSMNCVCLPFVSVLLADTGFVDLL